MNTGSNVVAARHNAMNFGATASVHAWNRIGALITCIARRLLFIPLLRYVDDVFSVDRPQCVEHSLECIARLVRAILGPDALKEKKMEFGSPLVVLGVKFTITQVRDLVRMFSGHVQHGKFVCLGTYQSMA